MTPDSERWDAELGELASPAPLLQTWAWGEVQVRSGWTVERVRLGRGAMASVQLRKVGPAREAYVPRGPVPATPQTIEQLVKWARDQRIARLVVEPEASRDFGDALAKAGFESVAQCQERGVSRDVVAARIQHLHRTRDLTRQFERRQVVRGPRVRYRRVVRNTHRKGRLRD